MGQSVLWPKGQLGVIGSKPVDLVSADENRAPQPCFVKGIQHPVEDAVAPDGGIALWLVGGEGIQPAASASSDDDRSHKSSWSKN